MKYSAWKECLWALASLGMMVSSIYAGNGGGFTMAGISGDYFSNTELTGSPTFERKDVRIDFDWGEKVSPGGSIAEPYVSFPTDAYSIRWEGEVLPAFSDEYTFRVFANDGARWN